MPDPYDDVLQEADSLARALHGPRVREIANLSSRGMSSANSESKVIALGRFHGYEFAALSGEEHWGLLGTVEA